MGIQGLLPFLQKSSRKVDMSEFSGCVAAIDVYCWLHKGAFSCAEKLARGEDTDQYVQYCMKFANMLISYKIKPILVFDGCHLPAKAETEKSRRERRESTKKKAGELLRSEKIDEARQMLRRCIDITHEMAHKLITRARAVNIDCIVAPFEADAQLAYLNLSGMAHFVVTEDSDLLLFGCSKVVFKLDIGGAGLLVEQEMLPVAMKMRPEEFTLDKFRQMCVLSGCDYLSSLPGIGLTKACKFVKLTSQSDVSKIIHKIGSYLNMPNLVIPDDYRYNFVNAINMFKHQPAFDPVKRRVVPLTPIEDGSEVILPKAHSPDIAYQLALGNIDPITLKVVDDWNPDIHLKDSKQKSIWSRDYCTPTSLPPPRVPKLTPAVKSTFGKRASVDTDDIIQIKKPETMSEEIELEQMRKTWGVAKKMRLDLLKESETEVSVDDLIEASPTKHNPFKAGFRTNSGNTPLSSSTTLSRLTSPSPVFSKFLSSQNSKDASQQKVSRFSKFTSTSSKNSSSPVVISRYFADPYIKSPKDKSPISASGLSNGFLEDAETVKSQPIVVPESPDRPSTVSPIKDCPTKRNIFVISQTFVSDSAHSDSVSKGESVNIKKTSRSLLSCIEDESEYDYKSLGSSMRTETSKPSLSNFKWKPLASDDKLALKTDFSSKSDNILLDTPPNSQESEVVSKPNISLEPARPLGLSKNKSGPMQTFLSKFKFQSKPKAKLK